MTIRTERSYCRLCSGLCGTKLSIDDSGRIVDLRGDHDHPMTWGYACVKGLQAPHLHYGDSRLLHPLRRQDDGSFARMPLESALDDIAAAVRRIVDESGPRSIALFRGTQSYFNSCAFPLAAAWLQALGSPCSFTTATIDQSAKFVAADRLGAWEAGWQPIETNEVWMAVGYNPLVSIQTLMGFPTLNPTKRLRQLKERGLKLIVIDPRRTETAAQADLHLQLVPGEDVTLAAALLNLILQRGWHDADFCAEHVQGLDALRAAVAPYTVDKASARCGVPAAQIVAAAELFARSSRRGFVSTCTGPDMTRHSNLAEHLYQCINVVCGRVKRAGEPYPNPGVFTPRMPRHARVHAPSRSWEQGPRSRVGPYHGFYGEMMSNTLADEILMPGEGRIRGLIVLGGNPLSALPDSIKSTRAFRQLDLLVSIDPFMTATARASHYILPPKVLYERADMTNLFETAIFPEPFAQITPALVPPPAGAEVVDDWYVFWSLARRLGLPLTLNGVALDMEQPPASMDLLRILARGARLPFDEIAAHPGGAVFDLPPQQVEAAPGDGGRFDVAPPDVCAELAEVARERVEHGRYLEEGTHYSHRLAVRRMREVINSFMHDAPVIRRRTPCNRAQLHPDDLAGMGMAEGDEVEIVGSQGRVRAILEADDSLRPGVVTLSHGWGGLPDEAGRYADAGVNVNLLVSSERYIEPINAMARMTGIPVNLFKVPAPPATSTSA
jgi:anaerobic selenocysteine-containing dehydrogenase